MNYTIGIYKWDWNFHSLRLLLEWAEGGLVLGKTVTIGRLHNSFQQRHGEAVLSKFPALKKNLEYRKAISEPYCEDVLNVLGAGRVDSIDISDYENASIIADLNHPIDKGLHEQFDTVIEGGTIEHIFDVKQSLENLMNMTKIGGHLYISQMCNNFGGHGFYQFSPEFFYRTLSEENGFRIRYCGVHEEVPFAPIFSCPDPRSVGRRVEFRNQINGLYIVVLAQKIEKKQPFKNPVLQSDYVQAWESTIGEQPSKEVAKSTRWSTLRIQQGIIRRFFSLFGLKPGHPPHFANAPAWLLRREWLAYRIFRMARKCVLVTSLSMEKQASIFQKNCTKMFF